MSNDEKVIYLLTVICECMAIFYNFHHLHRYFEIKE